MEPRPIADSPTTEVLHRGPGPPTAGPTTQGRRDGPFEAILRGTAEGRMQVASPLDGFLAEPDPWKAIATWLALTGQPHAASTREEVVGVLGRDIARIDDLLGKQVNAILHHPVLQKLEASWRGLRFLVEPVGAEEKKIKVRVLNVTWKELVRDQNNALEFDQSHLFRKVYEEEFGHPGGEPFGVLLGDYEVRHRVSPDHPHDDIETLRKIASVAAAAFAPFVASAHPSFFGLDQFQRLDRPLNLSKIFELYEHLNWKSLRQAEDARFLGLTLPRVLGRLPYLDDGSRSEDFRFREDVKGPDLGRYLWGNAVYSFGSVLIRSFDESSWLASIRGVRRGEEGGGLVSGLPVHSFATDRAGLAVKCSTDMVITDALEKEFGELGFIPLCHCQDTELSAFYGNQSVQKPKPYDTVPATVNARLSAMLQYMLCVSRFAHYIKVISRDMMGSMNGAAECEDFLQRWLSKYTTGDSSGPEAKARYPLREGKVQVRERPGMPGSYDCVIHLRPHFQLDQMVSSLKLRTELTPGRVGS